MVIKLVGGSDPRALCTIIFERVIKAAKELRPEGAPLLSYIFTSGTWVHGDSRTDVVTDTTPISHPVEAVAYRPAIEQLVVRSTDINGIVIRPSFIYGRSASLLGMLFKTASEGRVSWPGTPGGRYAVVHCDDLADLFLRAAENAQLIGGKIFDAANPSTISVDELLQRLTDVSGAKEPYEYRTPANCERYNSLLHFVAYLVQQC